MMLSPSLFKIRTFLSHIHGLNILLVLCFISSGCSVLNYKYKLKTIVNDRNRSTTYQMTDNLFFSSGRVVSRIELNAHLLEVDDMKKISLVLEYHAKKWLFIGQGESLVLDVDGKELALLTDGSINTRETTEGNKFGVERIWYAVSKEVFKKIILAKVVKVRINGGAAYEKYILHPFNVENLWNFYNKHVETLEEEVFADPSPSEKAL